MFYSVIPLLESLGIVKETAKGFALWFYDDAEETVVRTVRQWRRILFRDPLPSEIADETGLSPEQSEEIARNTRDKTGWCMPNPAIINSAAERLGEVLCYLARKKDQLLEDFDYEKYPDDQEIVKEAELGLEEHVEMTPKLSEDGMQVIFWSPEALKYLGKKYQPRDRCKPRLLSAH